MGTLGNRQNLYLHRSQPQGECTGKMLGDHADKPLNGAKDHPMDHNRAMLQAVLTDILQIEPLRQLRIQLDRTALPGTAQTVLNVEV